MAGSCLSAVASGFSVSSTYSYVPWGTSQSYDVIYLDTDNYHDTGDNTKATIPVDGYYLVFADYNMTWQTNGGGDRKIKVRKNGSTDLVENTTTGGTILTKTRGVHAVWAGALSAGDYLEIGVYHAGTPSQTGSTANLLVLRLPSPLLIAEPSGSGGGTATLTPEYDDGNYWASGQATRATAASDGIYLAVASTRHGTGGYEELRVNGSAYMLKYGTGKTTSIPMPALLDLTAGDYLEWYQEVAPSTDGGQIIVAYLGASVRSVFAKPTSDQAFTSFSEHIVDLGGEDFDTDTFHDNTTNNQRLTVGTGDAGDYVAIGALSTDSALAASTYIKYNTGFFSHSIDFHAGPDVWGTGVHILARSLAETDYFRLAGAADPAYAVMDDAGCRLGMFCLDDLVYTDPFVPQIWRYNN